MGLFGIIGRTADTVASAVYYGLYALQHRGQESAGIVVNDDGIFRQHKDTGLVGDVFDRNAMEKLSTGEMAIGHCRYGTLGTKGVANEQLSVLKPAILTSCELLSKFLSLTD